MTLSDYANELGLYGEMTLKSLISSHRELRKQALMKQEEWLEELAKGREIGKKQGIQQVTDGEYIAKDELKKMTLQEICEFIGSS